MAVAAGPEAVDFSRVDALATHGVTILPFTLPSAAGTFDAMLEGLREYRPGALTKAGASPSLTGYGAIVGASAFHHPFTRALRRAALAAALPALRRYAELVDLHAPIDDPCAPATPVPPVVVCQTFDSLTQRGVHNLAPEAGGRRATKRAPGLVWHRDASPRFEHGSRLGGWMNLSSEPQPFNVMLGTATDAEARVARGFFKDVTPPPSSAAVTTIMIPPGHLMLFRREMKHAVTPGTHVGERRLFLAFHITYAEHLPPHDTRLDDCMARGTVPHSLSTGRPVESFPAPLLTNALDRLSEHSVATFAPEVLHVVKGRRVVLAEMPPVTALPGGAAAHGPYSDEDRAVMTYQPLEALEELV